MQHLSENRARPRIGRALGRAAAAVLCVAALCQPNLSFARGGGGHGGGFHGGFHGGGFHGGFHGGGFHASAFHGGFHGGGFYHGPGRVASLHSGFGHGHRVINHNTARATTIVHNRFGDARGDHWYHGWHNGRYGWWLWGPGLAWTLYSYPESYGSQTWYYCSDPAGYYPYVTQCNTGWQAVPAG
jgi:hypothetical protein